MVNQEKELIEAIRQAVLKGDEDSLKQQTFELDSHLTEVGSFSVDLFQELLRIIALPEFLNLDGSYVLLKIFEYSFDYLSEEQKTELLQTLEAVYDSFTDFTSCFLISEIIGELYGDERALQTLRRLKTTKAEMPRSMVPHGLEYFVKKSSNPQLAGLAFNELMQMKSDPSEDVRDEVSTSLAQLKKHGWPPPSQ